MFRSQCACGIAATAAITCLVAASVLFAEVAQATTVQKMTLEEKAVAAPVIVHGKVTSVRSELTPNRGAIETYVSISVLDGIKGAAKGQKLTLRQAGGKIGEFEHRVHGTPTWTVGEEVLLFGEPNHGQIVEIGIGIGKYEVQLAGAVKQVTQKPSVAELRMTPDGPKVAPAATTGPEPLATFTRRVRAVLSKPEFREKTTPAP